jgi:hypothetical protein
MAFTGHSTREMFDRYNTVDMDDARTAVLQTVDQGADSDKPDASGNA